MNLKGKKIIFIPEHLLLVETFLIENDIHINKKNDIFSELSGSTKVYINISEKRRIVSHCYNESCGSCTSIERKICWKIDNDTIIFDKYLREKKLKRILK